MKQSNRDAAQEATTMRNSREIAFAAAADAGNRSMKSGGRTVWALKDYNAAVAELNRLADRKAYEEGRRAGRADRLLGVTNDYATHGTLDADPYSYHYSRGYRAGQEAK